jgi:hypothetical protein
MAGMLNKQAEQRVKELCDLIAKEQDRHRFSSLVAELNRLLDDCSNTPATDLKKKDSDPENLSFPRSESSPE